MKIINHHHQRIVLLCLARWRYSTFVHNLFNIEFGKLPVNDKQNINEKKREIRKLIRFSVHLNRRWRMYIRQCEQFLGFELNENELTRWCIRSVCLLFRFRVWEGGGGVIVFRIDSNTEFYFEFNT